MLNRMSSKRRARGGRKVGDGSRIIDRSGRVWEYANYQSPKGPAFWLTIPDDLTPDHVAYYTIHFDGVIGVVGPCSE